MFNLKPHIFVVSGLIAVLQFTASLQLSAQHNPKPEIDQPLLPASKVPGAPGFTMTVNGAGFVQGASVTWNGSALTTQFVSSVQLTAFVPGSDIAGAGTATVAVKNPTPGGGSSNPISFPVAFSRSEIALDRTDFPGAAEPVELTVADLNGDGYFDLVVSNSADDTISVLLGDGRGFFLESVYATGITPGEPVVGDFNGDGIPDIAVPNSGCSVIASSCVNPQGSVSILVGNGDGTFQSHVDYAAGAWTTAAMVGDFNGDGNLDVIAVNGTCPGVPCSTSTSSISVLLGNGDGTFLAPVEYTVGLRPVSGVVGDFNGDGKLDVATSNDFDYTISVLIGNGDGTFQAQKTFSTGKVGIRPTGIAAADFNGDGNLDLAVVNEGTAGEQAATSSLAILLGNGDGTFKTPVEYVSGTAPQGVVVGDMDGDGVLDLVVTNSDSGTISLYLGNVDGTFKPQSTFAAVGQPSGIVSADFNGDGQLDIAIAEQSVGSGTGLGTISTFISPTLALTPKVIATPSSSIVTTERAFSVSVTVSSRSGSLAPTGSVTLTSSNYHSAAAVLQGGSATINVAPGSLMAGSNVLVAIEKPQMVFYRGEV